jgi:glycosyltransferase involved in cell wall biosynthesis
VVNAIDEARQVTRVSPLPFRQDNKSESATSTDEVTISVVIAVRDGERTIGAAVQSALDQTSPPTQVIVVDDMSTDATKQRVLDLTSDRVVVVAGEGRGVAAARNSGIRTARGSWIAFLDGDDYWEPEFLESARQRVDSSSDAVACFGAAVPIDDHGRVVGRHTMHDVVAFEDLVSGRIVPTTSATLVRRDALIACDGFFERFRSLAGVEDLDLWLRIAARGPCVGVTRPLAVYVVHDERDRRRSVEALVDLEGDRELVIDRLAAAGASARLVRRGRAVMRARTARYWLRAQMPAYARAAAASSLRARPTLEGFVTLTLASLPRSLREAMVVRRRRRRAAGPRGGT